MPKDPSRAAEQPVAARSTAGGPEAPAHGVPGARAEDAPGFDLRALIEAGRAEQSERHAALINPKFVRALRTIGYDRTYLRGSGGYLWDESGRRYLDLLSGYGMFNVGRNHPTLKETVRTYLELDEPWKIQMGTTVLPGLLAERLLAHVPHLDRVHFTNSGAESVETALKLARGSTGRERVIYCDRGFHGLSYGALSVNGCPTFREGFVSFLPGPVSVPLGDLDALRREMEAEPTAAFILEPVQGKGVHVAGEEYLLGAQELCRTHGAQLVVDEVQTGLGRTGRMFAYQHVPGLEPDMVLVAKSLSGGLVPAGAVLVRREIFDAVFSSLDRSVVHSSTFGQGGLAMACGLATLHVLEAEGLIENAATRGRELLEAFAGMADEFELLDQVRGRGLMIGVELGPPRSLALKAAWSAIHRAEPGLFPQAILMPLLERHAILAQVAGHGVDVIKLLPPLALTDDDVAWILDAFREVLERAHRFPGPVWTTARNLVRFAIRARSGGRDDTPVEPGASRVHRERGRRG